jgi:RNA polymerase sigma-70 factor (ECF subfamily)
MLREIDITKIDHIGRLGREDEQGERRAGRDPLYRKGNRETGCHKSRRPAVYALENGRVTQQISTASAFEAVRSRLFGLAYRMLGSRADAEDIVQETYLRWHKADQGTVENPEAWLVTAATRLAIDRLRRLQTEREAYVGPWLPEPILSEDNMPDRHLELASDLSIAMMTLLETLAPDERAAFLLHDVFDVDYGRIASIIGKSEAACRQVIHRARERVRGSRKRFESTESGKRALLEKFKTALEAIDEQALVALFAPDATWMADGGGRTAAATHPLVGVDQIMKVVIGLRRKSWPADRVLELATINGEPGLCVRDGGRLTAVMAFDTDGGQIVSVYAVVNPDKLPQSNQP